MVSYLVLPQVYHRLDTMALGKVSLNIVTGVASPAESSPPLVSSIAEAVQSLLPYSHLMPLTLDNLNNGLLAPRKDYVTNRLRLPLFTQSCVTVIFSVLPH